MSKRRNQRRRQHSTTATQPIHEAWGDLIDTRDYLRDEPDYFGGGTGFGSGPWLAFGSREHGRDYPLVFDEQDLMVTRQLCRWAAASDGTGKNIVKTLANYVIGKGFAYRIVAKKGQKPDAKLITALQSAIDEFIKRNKFATLLEREIFTREVRDGESLTALFPQADGRVVLRIVEPEQVRDPGSIARELECKLDCEHFVSDWTFGVHTSAEDVQEPLGYFIAWNAAGTDYDYLAVSRAEHGKRNVDRNVKRGISDFYPILEDMNRASKVLKNSGAGAAIQAAIVAIREHPGGTTNGQIRQFQSDQTQQTVTQTTPSGTRERNIGRYGAGTFLDVRNGQKYLPPALASGEAANAFLAILQATLRKVGSNWCMPEYMISGDASNANYASTMVSESPFVKNCEHEQATMIGRYDSIICKALDLMFEAGRFAGVLGAFESMAEVWTQVELQITPPAVATRDELKNAQSNQILNAGGVLSLQSWTAELGKDYDQEQQNLANHSEHFGPTPEPLPLPKETLPVDAGQQ